MAGGRLGSKIVSRSAAGLLAWGMVGARLSPTRQGPTGSAPVCGRRACAWLRDELLDGEVFYSLSEAQIVIESWRRHFNTVRPDASLGHRPPAPEAFVP